MPDDCAIVSIVRDTRTSAVTFVFEVVIPGEETIAEAVSIPEVNPVITRHTPDGFNRDSVETYEWDWKLPK